MYKLLALLLFGIMISTNSPAQDAGFLPGYIITNSNDTIRGEVKYINLMPYRILVNIKFRKESKGKTEVYKPGEIIGYGVEGKVFHSRTPSKYHQTSFMELLVDGYVKLYRSTETMIGSSQSGSANISNDFLLKGKEETMFDVQKGKFKETLSAYLSDNNTLAQKIRNGDYKRRDIVEIITAYNKQRAND